MKNSWVGPAPGYVVDEIGKEEEGIFDKNLYYYKNGIKCREPWAESLKAFKPTIDPRTMRPDFAHIGPLGITRIDKPIPEGYVADGINPYYQIVQRLLMEQDHLLFYTMSNIIIRDKRYLPATERARAYLQKILNDMNEYGYVLVDEEPNGGKTLIKYYKYGGSLRTGDIILPLKEGYDPIIYYAFDFVKKSEPVSKDILRQYLLNYLRWVHNYKEFNDYIVKMLHMKLLTIPNEGYYETFNMIEPY